MRPLDPTLALLFVLAAPAGAQSPEAAPSAAPAETEAAAERGERYLLRLADGRVLRCRARQSAGAWEVRGDAGWSPLEPGAVLRARLEADVLAEARRLAKSGADDPARAVALAEWLAAEGLLAEAALELDRVLALEPDQPAALALIARTELPVRMPERGALDEAAFLRELLAQGAQAGPVGRELAVRELAALDLLALRAALADELVAGSDRRRSFATLVQRRLFPGDRVRELLVRAVLDSSEDVRRGAALALRDAREVAVIVPIVRALSSASPAVRANAIGALGDIGYPAAVEPLIGHLAGLSAQRSGGSGTPHSNIFVGKQLAYIQDFDVEVAQFQATADPQINVLVSGQVLDAGVHSAREYAVTYEKRAARGALRKLTGADPGDRAADWMRWWEENRERWRASDAPRPAGTPTAPATRGVEQARPPADERSELAPGSARAEMQAQQAAPDGVLAQLAPGAADEADRRRVLALADGTHLRGRSRCVGGRWETRADGAWVAVAGEVVAQRLETDLAAEARARAAALGRDAHAERVELARWMLDEGLEEEALAELERVLAAEPDHAGALALVRERPIALRAADGAVARAPADALEQAIKLGAGGTPAVREVAVRRAAALAGSDLRAVVLAELKAPQPSRRAFAALLARRLCAGEMLPELARRAVLDPMSDVRGAAALALRDARSPRAVDLTAGALASRHDVLRVRAAEALGRIGQPAAVEPLVTRLAALQASGAPSGVRGTLSVGLQTALVTDYDVEIAQGASIGDPIVSIQDSGVVHDVRAQAQISRQIELQVVVAALRELVPGAAGERPEAWLEWWEREGRARLARPSSPATTGG